VRSGNIAFQDFYRDNQDQRVYLKVLVPIRDIASPKTLLGILALRIDPEEYLYPLIHNGPYQAAHRKPSLSEKKEAMRSS